MSNASSTTDSGLGRVRVVGIIVMILGLLALGAPLLTGLSIVLLVGILVVIGGCLRMAWAFQAARLGHGVLVFVIGLLTLLCGIAMVTDPILASGVLTIILAIYLGADGILEILTALTSRSAPGWGWLLAGGIISLLLGLMLWRQFPLSGAWAIGVMLGLKLLLVGLTMSLLAPAPATDSGTAEPLAG